ncbi:MAG: mechanosensitive ion channel family protein, partial [Planctomycetota bacterium]
TVPNSDLMVAAIDNMGRRRYRRTSTKLGVLYSTTPEQLEAFCEGIREIIRTHPYTRKDYFHVYVNEFGPSSINVLLYCFHECPDWGTELRERQRLFLDILRLAQRLGVEFAFPTQTVHLHHDSTPDSPPPESPPIPHDPDAAAEYGRSEANKLVRELLEDGQVPPPVQG